jgi:geranylgeranyl diphosphate synthase type II
MTTVLPLRDYLTQQATLVEAALDRYLPAHPACPAVLSDAMRYSLLGGGKRFRPVLTLAAAETVSAHDRLQQVTSAPGENPAALALPAACALEMIHTYSLIHDDLPAMDDDTLRRGRPTCHVVHGEGMAILAGDGLLTEAFALLAREPADPEGRYACRMRRTIGIVAAAAGAVGMVGGQAIDLHAEGTGSAMPYEALRDMHARKTGALIRAAATSGAVMAGGTDHAVEALDRYAAALGLAFQIVDDILDVEGDTVQLGKTAGKDAAAGKPTYPALFGLERSKQLAAEALDSALSSLRDVGVTGGRLEEIARWVVGRSH